MKVKIKCYVKEVKTAKSTFITRYTFIPVLNHEKNEKEDELYSVKFTKDVSQGYIPEVSSNIICDDTHVNVNHEKRQVWITGVESVIPMERPVTDLSQYFEVVDEEAVDEEVPV